MQKKNISPIQFNNENWVDKFFKFFGIIILGEIGSLRLSSFCSRTAGGMES